jgi:hypothetical protein
MVSSSHNINLEAELGEVFKDDDDATRNCSRGLEQSGLEMYAKVSKYCTVLPLLSKSIYFFRVGDWFVFVKDDQRVDAHSHRTKSYGCQEYVQATKNFTLPIFPKSCTPYPTKEKQHHNVRKKYKHQSGGCPIIVSVLEILDP